MSSDMLGVLWVLHACTRVCIYIYIYIYIICKFGVGINGTLRQLDFKSVCICKHKVHIHIYTYIQIRKGVQFGEWGEKGDIDGISEGSLADIVLKELFYVSIFCYHMCVFIHDNDICVCMCVCMWI